MAKSKVGDRRRSKAAKSPKKAAKSSKKKAKAKSASGHSAGPAGLQTR